MSVESFVEGWRADAQLLAVGLDTLRPLAAPPDISHETSFAQATIFKLMHALDVLCSLLPPIVQ